VYVIFAGSWSRFWAEEREPAPPPPDLGGRPVEPVRVAFWCAGCCCCECAPETGRRVQGLIAQKMNFSLCGI
jgi:hypothetical protein